MASVIRCDMCDERAAMFLVTFTPNGDTVGVGVECVASWAESTLAGMGAADLDPDQRAAGVFRVTMIPTGDVETFSLDDLAPWAEGIVAALDHQDDTPGPVEPQEPQEAPEPPRAARTRKRAATPRRAPDEGQSDDEWEASGRRLHAVPAEGGDTDVGEGPGLEASEPTAARDQG